MDKYDGLSNLDEHVDTFVTQMNLFTNDGAIMSRVFPITPRGATLHWYTYLLKNLIDSLQGRLHVSEPKMQQAACTT